MLTANILPRFIRKDLGKLAFYLKCQKVKVFHPQIQNGVA